MTDLESYCMVCGEAWDDYYDVIAHVYNTHAEETCGAPPQMHVETRPKMETQHD